MTACVRAVFGPACVFVVLSFDRLCRHWRKPARLVSSSVWTPYGSRTKKKVGCSLKAPIPILFFQK
jgi:hypothetical protein